MKLETLCVQEGYEPKNGEPRVLPICQSTTFKYDSSDYMGKLFDLEESGFFYTRLANPTAAAVEKKITALEGGVGAMMTSSGQAATMAAIMNIAGAGDNIICSAAVYGGTFNLLGVTLEKYGISTTFVDPDASLEELQKVIKPNTKAVLGETISNPALVVLDIEKFAELAHSNGIPLIVDNTFATPMLCRPRRPATGLRPAFAANRLPQLRGRIDRRYSKHRSTFSAVPQRFPRPKYKWGCW